MLPDPSAASKPVRNVVLVALLERQFESRMLHGCVPHAASGYLSRALTHLVLVLIRQCLVIWQHCDRQGDAGGAMEEGTCVMDPQVPTTHL
jgi:hypothetical protein